MLNFLQNKVKNYLTSNFFVVLTTLVLISLIPIIRSFGRLNIGHDTLIPLIPEFSYKTAYQWNDINNGVYYSNNYFVWISIFSVFTSLGLNIYQTAFAYQFFIYFFSALGIYSLYNLFNKRNKLFALLPAAFIIFSPHYLDHLIYYLGTVGFVWASYFLFRFIKYRKLTLIDIMGVSLAFGIIADLPNPKYHFLLTLLIFLTVFLALLLKIISLKNIASNIGKILLLLIGLSYLVVPFLYFGYSLIFQDQIKINVKQGYAEIGAALDYGSALLQKMIRLYHTPSLNTKDYELTVSLFFFLAYYAIPIIVLGMLPIILHKLDKFSQKIYLIFYVLALFFLFIAKGSNPPFGFIYDFMLSSKAFAFMRTTAGVVIFAAIFYALIYGRVFQFVVENKNIAKKLKGFVVLLFIIILITTGYVYWSGHYFLNRSTVNPNVDRNKYGMQIPMDYFLSASFLRKLHLDTKVDIYPYTRGYQYNEWGYYGYTFFPWLLDKPIITFDKQTIDGKIQSNSNARYIYHDKTLGSNYNVKYFWHKPEKLVFSTNTIDVYRKLDADYLPHFYTAKSATVSTKLTESLLKKIPANRLAVISKTEKFQLTETVLSTPFIEYKKISPTKYRLRIHKANGPFLLVLTENFHSLWKLYLTDVKININSENTLVNNAINHYRILKNNENDQATTNEVVNYIKEGTVTSLGDLMKKNQQYYLMNGFEKIKEYEENYTINFISKKKEGTVQNDNLDNGTFYETFLQQTLDPPHTKINNYANGWFINPDWICSPMSDKPACRRLADGSYDFELILEFWPQKLATISYGISISIAILLFFIYFSKVCLSLLRRITLLKPK